jgi:iron complex outermembrane receptor protein
MRALLLVVSLAYAQQGPTAPQRRDTVIVTGTFEPVPLEEAERAVTVFEVRSESLLFDSIADWLRLDPSLDLRQRAPGGVQADLSIRGGSFGQTLVLLNGLRLNDVQSGHHNLDFPVPIEAVSRVEILRGSGSTLYGSDAVGGVVHFLAAPPEVPEVRLRAAAGNFGMNQERASITTGRPRWSQQLAMSRDFSSGFQANRDYRNLSLVSSSSARSRLGNSGLLLAHNDRPFGAQGFYGNFNSWERTRTWFAGVRQALGDRTEASIAFRRHTDLFVLYRDRPEVFTNRHAVESWQGALRRREELGATNRLHYGIEGLRESIASNNLGEHTRARGAVYASWDARALRRFSLSVGAREERYRAGLHQFSPSIGGGVWLNSHLKLRASASRAFRLPTFTDLYYHDPANLGSPDLRPERAWSYESGLDWHTAGKVRAELTVFHRRERDGIDYIRSSPTDIWRATNFQALRFTGVEGSVTLFLSRRQRLDLRYTGLHGAQGAAAGVLSKYVFNYPLHSAVTGWQGRLRGGLAARTRLAVLKRRARDAYALWDVYLARVDGRLSPFLHLTNLTGTTYEEILGVPMPRRGVLFGLELRLAGR